MPGLAQLRPVKTQAHCPGGATQDDDEGGGLKCHSGQAAFQVMPTDEGHASQQQAEKGNSIHG